MEVLKIKAEPFCDEKQEALLNIKLMKNEDKTFTLPSREGGSLQERSLHTILKSGLVKEEQEEQYGATEKTENTFIKVKTEWPGDLQQNEVISKFNECSDDDLDSSKYDVIKVKTEWPDDLQQSEVISKFNECSDDDLDSSKYDVIKVKTEWPDDLQQSEVISKFSESSGDDLDSSEYDIKVKTEWPDDLDSSQYGVIKVKTETEFQEDLRCVEPRLESIFGEGGSLLERSLHIILKSGLVKEEQEEKYGATEKTEVVCKLKNVQFCY
ncbi:uncharacterized protein LOC106462438 isoform X2 [Limulus polyphemus]|uniref:Uncharacterized protein LOC106462438 isoform X2 n=1 Tax=Limulus polyphemus TaxID=6850 RepID=A0ABM1SP61_LIMPO|nr:uncharacterized protein LOC106462438 isoform X2 [Limulus polyphemus]